MYLLYNWNIKHWLSILGKNKFYLVKRRLPTSCKSLMCNSVSCRSLSWLAIFWFLSKYSISLANIISLLLIKFITSPKSYNLHSKNLFTSQSINYKLCKEEVGTYACLMDTTLYNLVAMVKFCFCEKEHKLFCNETEVIQVLKTN